jgi:Cft2 family RNA processing exonuclease
MRFLGLGGTDEVGASSYLYELSRIRLLVDAGLRPTMMGEASLPMLEVLEEHPPELMILTHAHLDHVGALPLVTRRFPGLKLFATRATQRIAMDVLADAVKVGESQGAALYGLDEAVRTVSRFETLEPFIPLAFPGGQVTALPAGHILGAVGLLIEDESGRVFHTGDFSNIATLTADKAYQPAEPVEVDAVVSEATYGDTNLPGRKDQIRELIEALRGVFEGGGRVLIPTFALGRAQELILLLLNHQASGLLPRVPIYLDGLVRTLTSTFEDLLAEMPEKLKNFARTGGSPFFREGVVVVKDKKERERILGEGRPAVILASSGMLSGGPSPVYARALLQEVDSALFVVGYQDAESPGRRLLELERGGEVKLPTGRKGEFEAVPALCRVGRYYLSAHADRVGILSHLSRYPSRRVVLMHGEANARYALMEALKKDRHVNVPKNGEWLDLLEATSYGKASRPQAEPSNATSATEDTAPKQASKIRRFKTNIELEVKGQQLVLSFAEDINLKALFPEGNYKLTVMKGSITRVELKEHRGDSLSPRSDDIGQVSAAAWEGAERDDAAVMPESTDGANEDEGLEQGAGKAMLAKLGFI